ADAVPRGACPVARRAAPRDRRRFPRTTGPPRPPRPEALVLRLDRVEEGRALPPGNGVHQARATDGGRRDPVGGPPSRRVPGGGSRSRAPHPATPSAGTTPRARLRRRLPTLRRVRRGCHRGARAL